MTTRRQRTRLRMPETAVAKDSVLRTTSKSSRLDHVRHAERRTVRKSAASAGRLSLECATECIGQHPRHDHLAFLTDISFSVAPLGVERQWDAAAVSVLL